MAFFADGNRSRGEREDRGSRWVIVAFAVIGLLHGYLPARCWLTAAVHPLSRASFPQPVS
jgi:hypothetical protein